MNRKRQNSTNKTRAAGRKPAAEQARAAGKESPRKRPADAPYKKNDLVTVRIRDIAEGGEGIGRVPATDGQSAGYTLFVKDAVIGDIVQAQITKPGRSYAYARLYAISEPSPHRVQAPCPVYRSCGGCQLQALDYAQQLAYKTGKVRSDLQRIGGFSPEELDRLMQPALAAPAPFHYRNKAQVPVGMVNGCPAAGFYAGRTHSIIPHTTCLLEQPSCHALLTTILSWMGQNKIPAYDEETGKGLVRHVLLRTGRSSGEILVCLIVNGNRLPQERQLVEMLRETELGAAAGADAAGAGAAGPVSDGAAASGSAAPHLVGIVLNTNTARTNVILGQQDRILWGRDWIQDSLQLQEVTGLQTGSSAEAGQESDAQASLEFTPAGTPISFRISPHAFYQVNAEQTERLYSIAVSLAGLTGEETVWDLYCGVGTISLFMAQRAGRVCGVEIIPEAVENARQNALRSGIFNAEFFVGKAEEVLPAQAALGARADVICVDPPRKGCDRRCLDTILQMSPQRVVYISCNPATLARDLKILREGGYSVEIVQPVDMFPQTVHIETIVLLQKLNS